MYSKTPYMGRQLGIQIKQAKKKLACTKCILAYLKISNLNFKLLNSLITNHRIPAAYTQCPVHHLLSR